MNMHITLLTLVAVPLFVLPLAAPATAEMPGDFLKVESRAWGRWLNEKIDVSWAGVPLKDVLAREFAPAEFAVDPAKSMDTPVTLSEAEHREQQVGGVTLTAMTQVMRSDFKTYLDWKQRGQVTKEEVIDGRL